MGESTEARLLRQGVEHARELGLDRPLSSAEKAALDALPNRGGKADPPQMSVEELVRLADKDRREVIDYRERHSSRCGMPLPRPRPRLAPQPAAPHVCDPLVCGIYHDEACPVWRGVPRPEPEPPTAVKPTPPADPPAGPAGMDTDKLVELVVKIVDARLEKGGRP